MRLSRCAGLDEDPDAEPELPPYTEDEEAAVGVDAADPATPRRPITAESVFGPSRGYRHMVRTCVLSVV